jgi:hypothetical protein
LKDVAHAAYVSSIIACQKLLNTVYPGFKTNFSIVNNDPHIPLFHMRESFQDGVVKLHQVESSITFENIFQFRIPRCSTTSRPFKKNSVLGTSLTLWVIDRTWSFMLVKPTRMQAGGLQHSQRPKNSPSQTQNTLLFSAIGFTYLSRVFTQDPIATASFAR